VEQPVYCMCLVCLVLELNFVLRTGAPGGPGTPVSPFGPVWPYRDRTRNRFSQSNQS